MTAEETQILTSEPLGKEDEPEAKGFEFTQKGSDFDIEVVDDRPEEDRVTPRQTSEDHDEELQGVGKSVQKRINKLKYDFHEERRKREAHERLQNEAVRYAENVNRENQQLRAVLNQGEKLLIDEMKARTSTEVDAAKNVYKHALEEGDSEAIIAANEALASASYDAKKAGEYAPVTASQSAIRPPPAQPKPRVQPDSKASEWAQQNSWFQKDREMTAFAFGVHETLVSQEGLDPTSDAYYRRIDEKMQERFPDKFEGEVVAEEPQNDSRPIGPPRRPSSVVAPATRNSGVAPRKIQLTATQVKLAKRLGVTPEQYARQVLELEKING
jgi:hypothetical protein